MTIKFDEYLNEELKNPEFQQEWLRQTILEYIEDGDYMEFLEHWNR